MQRRIAHLDMDAFFASVELLRRPELRGQPVVIGGSGDPRSRSVVSTASYEARTYGVHSAMPMRQALALCPHAVFLPVDFAAYRQASRRFKAAIATVTDRIEDRGIDEVYLDLSEVDGIADQGGAAIGMRLKALVMQTTGLTCSIGIAPNKLLAKLASDLDKPDGLTLVDEGMLAQRIWPLPARRINGIGPKADARLQALGIRTIGELAAADPGWLVERFGANYGRWLHEAAHGRDERPVVTDSEPRSISRETTFPNDLHLRRDWHALAALLSRLSRELGGDLQRKGYCARTIGVKVRYDNFKAATRDVSLTWASQDPVALRRAAFECLSRVPTDRRLRLLGVKATNLVPLEEAAAAIRSVSEPLPGQVATPRRPASHVPGARTGTDPAAAAASRARDGDGAAAQGRGRRRPPADDGQQSLALFDD